jgi:hypothetical protein
VLRIDDERYRRFYTGPFDVTAEIDIQGRGCQVIVDLALVMAVRLRNEWTRAFAWDTTASLVTAWSARAHISQAIHGATSSIQPHLGPVALIVSGCFFLTRHAMHSER